MTEPLLVYLETVNALTALDQGRTATITLISKGGLSTVITRTEQGRYIVGSTTAPSLDYEGAEYVIRRTLEQGGKVVYGDDLG